MKFFSALFISVLALTGLLATDAQATVIGGKPFVEVIHLAVGPNATQSARNSGRDYGSPKAFIDGDLLAIPKNVVIDNIYVKVDTTVTGLTAFSIGDDDAATGFVTSASPTFTADNLYFWEVDYKGAYLKGGATLTASVKSKLYVATGKEVKLDVTGTASVGRARVFISGYAIGPAE